MEEANAQPWDVYGLKRKKLNLATKSKYTTEEPIDFPECLPLLIDSDIITASRVMKRYNNIVKSPEDKRVYRGLELTNRLKVLLVSDPKADKAAAALNVNVGSMSDPDELPGLAHFCEHMLFLGTEKYPEENEYSKFLSEHGGSCNAVTYLDHTTYYFDVLPPHLGKTLDIFAEFFKSPLFTESATARELNAVNSEHESNLPCDNRRLNQVFRSTGLHTHPYNKFGTGNKTTLETTPNSKNIDVRKELLKFYHTWYSSNIMTLAVLGKESLEELETMVVSLFSAIEDKSVTAPIWPDHPFPPELRRKKTYCVPIKNTRSLTLDFPFPDVVKYYKSGSEGYLLRLLGHEGPGSLLSALRRRGWSNDIYTSLGNRARGFDFFEMYVDLTEEGLDHVDDIIYLVFQYIALLKSEDPHRWLWEEDRELLALDFRFKDEQNPSDMVEHHVTLLQNYPIEDVLSTDQLTEWRPDLIKEFLSLLTPENVQIEIIAKAYADKCTMTEPWYGTKYIQEDIPDSLLKEWSSVKLCEELKLPQPNEFIPTNLSLVQCGDDQNDVIAPAIIKDTPWVRLWYKKDTEFLMPKGYITLEMFSPLAYADPLAYNLTTIWLYLLQDSLQESTYAALIAGMSWNIWNSYEGVTVNVQGYDDKQHLLLNKIIEQIVTYKVDPKRFHIIKEIYIRAQKNFEAEPPWEHAFLYEAGCLTHSFWTTRQLLDAAEAITPEQVDDYSSRMIRNVHVEILVYGNFTKERAIQIADSVENKLPKDGCPLLSHQMLLSREIELDGGAWYILEVQNSVSLSSCASVYYACGLRTTRHSVLLQLLVQIMAEPCFDVLRTKEQLGYIVYCCYRYGHGAQGLRVTVQSNRHPQFLEQRIDAFLRSSLQQLENMSDEEFLKHRTALIAQILEKPKQMHGISSQLWSEITRQLYNFDRARVEVEQLKTVTKGELIMFYKKHISEESPESRKLSVHIISMAEGGAGHSNTKEDCEPTEKSFKVPTKITDLVEFKSGRRLYPHPAPFIDIPRKGIQCTL